MYLVIMVFKLVKCQKEYYEFIRLLRTDPRIKSAFISQKEITKDEQEKYMKIYQDDYYICLNEGNPVGFIGIVSNDIRLAVSPEFQNKGIASFMLKEINLMRDDYEVKIKSDNISSINFFKKNGFIEKERQFINNDEVVIMQKIK